MKYEYHYDAEKWKKPADTFVEFYYWLRAQSDVLTCSYERSLHTPIIVETIGSVSLQMLENRWWNQRELIRKRTEVV